MTGNYREMAIEYVENVGAHEAQAMAVLIFYEAARKAVADGVLEEYSLNTKTLQRLFDMAVNGVDGVPGLLESNGIELQNLL